MKKVLIILIVSAFSTSVFAQEDPIEKENFQWGGQAEISYIRLLNSQKTGWYAATEYGVRVAPNTTTSTCMLEGGLVYRVYKKAFVLLGAGTEYSFTEKHFAPIINTAFESQSFGIGVKSIFEDKYVVEITAIKFFTFGEFRLGIGGGYTSKENVPLVKIAVPFE